MKELPRLQEMLNASLQQAAQECGTLLGQEMELRETAVREVTRDDYFNRLDDASFVVGITSHEDYQGGFCLVITFRDAIVLGGTLLGVPPARINEKKKLAIIEPDDVDAFSEIANQLVGSFNSVFKRSLPRKAHLKQKTPKKFIPKQDPVEGAEPVEDGEYYLLQALPLLAGKELETLDILIPLPLARMFDIQERSKDAAAAEAEPAGSTPEEAAPEAPVETAAVLILEDNTAERQQFHDMLAATGVSPVGASLDADLKNLLSQQGLKAVLVGLNGVSDQELSVCRRITSDFRGDSVPIILCAREWTRTAVLKALKYGAGDILMKPCTPDELATRVQKLLLAA